MKNEDDDNSVAARQYATRVAQDMATIGQLNERLSHHLAEVAEIQQRGGDNNAELERAMVKLQQCNDEVSEARATMPGYDILFQGAEIIAQMDSNKARLLADIARIKQIKRSHQSFCIVS